MHFTLHNPGSTPLSEVARVSMPVPAGLMPGEPSRVVVGKSGKTVPVQADVITRHPDGSVRRVMLSFPVRLPAGAQARFTYGPGKSASSATPVAQISGATASVRTDVLALAIADGALKLSDAKGRPLGEVQAFGPAPTGPQAPTLTVIENGPFFAWLRWRQDGSDYSREIDLQADKLGRLRLTQRLLRHLTGNGWVPDFGFELRAPGVKPVSVPKEPLHFLSLPLGQPLSQHPELVAAVQLADGSKLSLANPLALRQHRGTLETSAQDGSVTVRFSRLEPVDQELQNLQHQEGMWQFIDLLMQPGPPEALAQVIDQPPAARVDWRAYDAVYHTGPPLQVKHPVLKALADQYVNTIHDHMLMADDLGSLGGLERYNHCQYIWEDVFRTGDQRLRQVALDYSENYSNYSVYWGPNADYYGGGRYPANNDTQPWPGTFRTRFNNAVTFCTKGYHSFWLAYEETGDPRFRYAAEQQAEWAGKHVTAGVNYTRCIGQVIDFVRLYEYTGERKYLDQAERLWGDFKAVQNPDLLFTEGGVLATGNDLYVPDDTFGYQHPYVKSYITQYATNALPYLLAHTPDDQRLRDTIVACNDWMAKVQTAAGGWSYPGPTTAGFNWNIEYCHGLMEGYEITHKEAYLDAIQRDLRAIVSLYATYDAIPSGVTPWEYLQGMTNAQLGGKYHLGTDRDRSRDFTDGRLNFGTSPDSTVYFQVLLRDYLRYRPEASLFQPDPVLDQVMRLPTSLSAGFPQTGDPSARITLTMSQTPSGTVVKLTGTSLYESSADRVRFYWSFPDGSTAEGKEVTHTFPRSGSVEIKLHVREGSNIGKNTDQYRTVTLIVPTGPGDLGLRKWPGGIRLQAEAFTGQGGGETGVKVREKSEKVGSDGGSISHWDPLNAWVEWTATVPQTGGYYVLLRYCTPADAARVLSLDGSEIGTISLPMTGGYSSTTDDWRMALLRDGAGKPRAVELSAGQHVLRLTNRDGKGCNLDYLELIAAPW